MAAATSNRPMARTRLGSLLLNWNISRYILAGRTSTVLLPYRVAVIRRFLSSSTTQTCFSSIRVKVGSGIRQVSFGHPDDERLLAGHTEMRLAMHDAPPRDFDGRTDGDRAELGQWSMAPRAVRQVRARAVRGHRSSSYP